MPISIISAVGEEQRLTLTLRLWLANKMADHFYGHHPVWMKLKNLNQVQTGGFGTQMKVPMKYPAAGGPVAEGVEDPFAANSFSAMTGITHSLWEVAQYRMPIAVPDRELVLQGSQTTKLSYLDSVMEIAMDRFMDKLRQDLWAAEGTAGSAGDPSHLASLRTLFNRGTNGTTTTPYSPAGLTEQLGEALGTTPIKTVGGINRGAAGMGYFCTPILNPSTADTMGKAVVNQLISLAIRGNDKPDLLIFQRDHWNTLMGILQAQRYITDSKLSDFGFEAFGWRGCDVIFDDDVPSTTGSSYNAFAINTKALKLYVKSLQPDVKKTEAPEQSIEAWKANWFGQLVMLKMGRGAGSRHGKISV